MKEFSIETMQDSHEFLISLLDHVTTEVMTAICQIIENNIKTSPENMRRKIFLISL